MNEESVAIQGIWASINSWFTPTILFVFLNLVIGTIAVTSGFGSQKHQNQNHQQNNHSNEDSSNNQQQQKHNHQQQQQNEQQQLNRSPSVLQRLKSINFYAYSYRSQEPISIQTPENKTHVLENRFDIKPEEQIHRDDDEQRVPEEEEELKSMEEIYTQLKGSSHNRTKSEIKPASGEIPIKLAKKMKKSASLKSPFAHFEEEVETRRPVTVKEAKVSVPELHDDEEVDSKADDFINKFKQQLKLQRLDSIVRYKDMLNRGNAK